MMQKDSELHPEGGAENNNKQLINLNQLIILINNLTSARVLYANDKL